MQLLKLYTKQLFRMLYLQTQNVGECIPTPIHLSAYGLFNDAIRPSDYITSNSIIIITGKNVDLKWSKAGLRYYPRIIPAWTEAIHENPWYRYS
jgi:hypothetical protein